MERVATITDASNLQNLADILVKAFFEKEFKKIRTNQRRHSDKKGV